MKDDLLGNWPELLPDKLPPRPIAYGALFLAAVVAIVIGLVIGALGMWVIDAAASWVLGV